MRKTTDKNVDDEEASSSEDDKDSSRLENLFSVMFTFSHRYENWFPQSHYENKSTCDKK